MKLTVNLDQLHFLIFNLFVSIVIKEYY